MKTFRDRVAVVTGAASGIGLALAARFAAEGAKVVMADIEAPALSAAAEGLQRQGATVLATRVDVSRPEDVERLARETYDAFGAAHVPRRVAEARALAHTLGLELRDAGSDVGDPAAV